jgi:murein DD-endopeptidase MepM/ murein hydrolase activator NlpD
MHTDRWEYIKVFITSLLAIIVVLSFYLYKSKLHIEKISNNLIVAHNEISRLKDLETINKKQKLDIERLNLKAERLSKRLSKVESLSEEVKILTEKSLGKKLAYTSRTYPLASRGDDTPSDSLDTKLGEIEKSLNFRENELNSLKSQLERTYEEKFSVPQGLPAIGGISSGFGWRGREFHTGVDIPLRIGTPIKSTANGTVSYVGWRYGYGLVVIVSHSYGFVTWYAHLSRSAVRSGERVEKGQIIGYSGATGNVTGPHLHYEVRRNGTPQNPKDYF